MTDGVKAPGALPIPIEDHNKLVIPTCESPRVLCSGGTFPDLKVQRHMALSYLSLSILCIFDTCMADLI